MTRNILNGRAMLSIRNLFLIGFIISLFLGSYVKAQTCSPCDLGITMTSGGTSASNISLGAGKILCITGPSSGAPATYDGTITFNGGNTVCISGLVNITKPMSTAWSKTATIVIQPGAVVTHSGTFNLQGAGDGYKTYFYNYGTYSNTSAQFNLEGTELYNSGTFTTSSSVFINSRGNTLNHTNTSTGIITIGGKLDVTWRSASDNITNNGQLIATCFYSSGASGVFSNPAGSTLKITGTDATCAAAPYGTVKAFNNGTTSLNVNGVFDVSNGTADFSTSSPATDLSGAKMYVTNFTGASHSFVTTPTCMSIKVTGQFNFNHGIVLTGLIYVWDTSPTVVGNDQGDKYAGATLACVVNGGGATGCAIVNNSWNAQSNLVANKFIYSSVDGGSTYGCPTLPVTFVSFSAVQTDNGNLLTWTTAEEVNAQSFIVERSNDGVNFEAIGVVDAQGNSSMLSNYQFIDNEVSSEMVYYRLNEIDRDGRNMYSSIVVVQVKKDQIAALLGNPVKEEIKIQLLTSDDNLVSIIDARGAVLFERVYPGSQLVNIKTHCAPGMYFIKVSNETQSSCMKVIVE